MLGVILDYAGGILILDYAGGNIGLCWGYKYLMYKGYACHVPDYSIARYFFALQWFSTEYI